VKKTLVVFLARLKSDSTQVINNSFFITHSDHFSLQVILSEHHDFQWFTWSSPPVPIQIHTIDPLLDKVYAHLNA